MQTDSFKFYCRSGFYVVVRSSTPPPFIKGVMKFFKNGCNWEDGKFLLKMVRKPGMRGEGVGFIIGGWKIFKVSLHSW